MQERFNTLGRSALRSIYQLRHLICLDVFRSVCFLKKGVAQWHMHATADPKHPIRTYHFHPAQMVKSD